MKKTLLIIFTLLALTGSVLAVPRNLVVVEVATGTWCVYCPGAAMGCHDLLQNGHQVAIVKNHTGDEYANTYSNARNSFYNPGGTPTTWFDGRNAIEGGNASSSLYSSYVPRVNSRLAIPSHFTISAVSSQNGSPYNVAVTVTKPEADTNTNIKLHAVLTESHIPEVWFNQTSVENVNRLMIPNQNGTAISLGTGESTTVNLTVTPSSSWVMGNLELVLFLQNMSTKEILQGVKYSFPALVGAYPANYSTLNFPDMSVTATNTIPVTITNYVDTPATGTISILGSPVFTSDASSFTLAPEQSITVNVAFTPTAAETFTGTLQIISNLNNHNTIDIPLSGTGFANAAPIATGVSVSGRPVLYQTLMGSYTFSDPDNHTEGNSIFKWYRVVDSVPTLIAGANASTYSPIDLDIGHPLLFEVTPLDQHQFPGLPVLSTPTEPIINLPAPQNFVGVLNPPNDVVLTWERPQYFETRGFVGYRIYRNGMTISTVANPSTLTFTDTYIPNGTHQYWICSMFNDPFLFSEPSDTVTIVVSVANDDQVLPVQNSIQVYPNPFRQSTSFAIQTKANEALTVSIFNLKGQQVKTYSLASDQSGNANITWDGTNNAGKKVNSGVYSYRLNGPSYRTQGRIVLMK